MADYWSHRLFALCEHIAAWSKDPSTKVGALVVDGKEILGLGYNGFPRGVDDLAERYADRPTKYSMIVHSEANALISASAHGRERLRDCALYTTKTPCSECAKLIIQFGLRDVFVRQPDGESAQRWLEDSKISRQMFEEAGVNLVIVPI